MSLYQCVATCSHSTFTNDAFVVHVHVGFFVHPFLPRPRPPRLRRLLPRNLRFFLLILARCTRICDSSFLFWRVAHEFCDSSFSVSLTWHSAILPCLAFAPLNTVCDSSLLAFAIAFNFREFSLLVCNRFSFGSSPNLPLGFACLKMFVISCSLTFSAGVIFLCFDLSSKFL